MLQQPFFIAAAIILLAAVPLILQMVPRNRGYGIRTAKTLANDETWYRANKFGGFMLFSACLIYIIVALAFPYNDPRNFNAWLIHLGTFLIPLVLGVVISLNYVKKL